VKNSQCPPGKATKRVCSSVVQREWVWKPSDDLHNQEKNQYYTAYYDSTVALIKERLGSELRPMGAIKQWHKVIVGSIFLEQKCYKDIRRYGNERRGCKPLLR